MIQSLQIKNLVVEANKPTGEWFTIVHDVNVKVSVGEVVALIGESGAGKSTVALAALGYSRPGTRIIKGHVYLEDIDILALKAKGRRRIRGRKIAYVAQSASAALNPAIPLGKQVAEGLLVHGIMSSAKTQSRVVELLKLLDLPSPKEIAKRYAHQISGGQQQRVMISMAMSCLPDFLVLDEPTTALDVTTQIEVLKAIKEVILKEGSGGIYVSHDLSVVAQIADRILVMNDGRVLEEGITDDVINNPQHKYTQELIKAVRLAPKYSKEHQQPIVKAKHNSSVIEIKDINATYEKRPWLRSIPEDKFILRGIDLSVNRGEVVALVGESGSGKSTLAKVITGLLPPVSGEIFFKDSKLHARVKRRLKDQQRRIQMVCQSPDTTINPELRIEQAIGRPLEFFFKIKGKELLKRVQELLAMVELPSDYAFRLPSELSGGEKQRVSLARAFGAEPDLLICDEVLSALDTIVGAAVLDLLKDLQNRLMVANIFISHDLATVASIADRVVVLYAGRICEVGPTENVFLPPFHPYTSLLIYSVPELRSGWLDNVLDSRATSKGIIYGEQAHIDSGCAFRNRCPLYIKGKCDLITPGGNIISEGHTIYCHRKIHDLSSN